MNVGFMQGRLSPLVDGKIQAFPKEHWREEFMTASKNSFQLMEWTLDQEGLYDNPLMSPPGRDEIRKLMNQSGIKIGSLTGDCFMQSPYWKSDKEYRQRLLKEFEDIISSCASLGITYIVVPLVDNGSIESTEQEQSLISGLNELQGVISKSKVYIVFESDMASSELWNFIRKLDSQYFGINYDIGNSAAAGFDPAEEISTYGSRIRNVHVKDRPLNGTTVPLGDGSADFKTVFKALKNCNYMGNYILQTARATNDNHSEVLVKYKKLVMSWINT